jgi:hypothetical protein
VQKTRITAGIIEEIFRQIGGHLDTQLCSINNKGRSPQSSGL